MGPTPPLGRPRQMVILDGPPEAPEPSRYLDYILITTTTNNNEWQAEIQPRHSAAQPVLRTLAGRRNSGAKRKKKRKPTTNNQRKEGLQKQVVCNAIKSQGFSVGTVAMSQKTKEKHS